MHVLESFDVAEFQLLELSLYPAVRTQAKAERVIASAQSLLTAPLNILSSAPHDAPTPMYRVNAEIPILCTGAYHALRFSLEFLRPLSGMWSITLPEPDLNDTSWMLWGRSDLTKVIGLSQVYFVAYSHRRGEIGAA